MVKKFVLVHNLCLLECLVLYMHEVDYLFKMYKDVINKEIVPNMKVIENIEICAMY